jgi:acylphosphatase
MTVFRSHLVIPKSAARHKFSGAHIVRRLLQSRGCEYRIRPLRMTTETFAKRFYVSGTVQGVGFRFFVERAARRLNISGYAKNLFDGRVEVYAIGSEPQLKALKSDLKRGPQMARVTSVEEVDADSLTEYANGFTIE